LYVVVRGAGDEPLLKLDWIRFDGPGMMEHARPMED